MYQSFTELSLALASHFRYIRFLILCVWVLNYAIQQFCIKLWKYKIAKCNFLHISKKLTSVIKKKQDILKLVRYASRYSLIYIQNFAPFIFTLACCHPAGRIPLVKYLFLSTTMTGIFKTERNGLQVKKGKIITLGKNNLHCIQYCSCN